MVRDADEPRGLLHEVELRGGLHHAHSHAKAFARDSRSQRREREHRVHTHVPHSQQVRDQILVYNSDLKLTDKRQCYMFGRPPGWTKSNSRLLGLDTLNMTSKWWSEL